VLNCAVDPLLEVDVFLGSFTLLQVVELSQEDFSKE